MTTKTLIMQKLTKINIAAIIMYANYNGLKKLSFLLN